MSSESDKKTDDSTPPPQNDDVTDKNPFDQVKQFNDQPIRESNPKISINTESKIHIDLSAVDIEDEMPFDKVPIKKLNERSSMPVEQSNAKMLTGADNGGHSFSILDILDIGDIDIEMECKEKEYGCRESTGEKKDST